MVLLLLAALRRGVPLQAGPGPSRKPPDGYKDATVRRPDSSFYLLSRSGEIRVGDAFALEKYISDTDFPGAASALRSGQRAEDRPLDDPPFEQHFTDFAVA